MQHPQRAAGFEKAECAAAVFCKHLQRRKLFAIPTLHRRAAHMIRVREIVLAAETDKRPVVAPLPIESLKRFEAFAIPFENARFTRMFRHNAIDGHALRQCEEMTRVERKRKPLL